MSKHLVTRWRRIAREWNNAADKRETQRRRGYPNEPSAIVAEQVDCRARAEALAECADSKCPVHPTCPECGCELPELGGALDAFAAIPDITLSKWACDPGGPWNSLRDLLRNRRAAQGFDVDAPDPETAFDERGWLKLRKAAR